MYFSLFRGDNFGDLYYTFSDFFYLFVMIIVLCHRFQFRFCKYIFLFLNLVTLTVLRPFSIILQTQKKRRW